MMASNVMGPVLAAGTFLLAGYQSYDTVDKIVSPPLIEAVGYVDNEVSAGGATLVHWVITKRTKCPGFTSRVWDGVGGFHLTEKVQATSLPISENKEYNIQTRIPELAPVGDLELNIAIQFDCDGDIFNYRLGPVGMAVVD